uniref:Uncharacterized protein n=1 Tax=Anguilla anguilla TaxID=7936 RepID=A0A0E9T429_ANGAN
MHKFKSHLGCVLLTHYTSRPVNAVS